MRPIGLLFLFLVPLALLLCACASEGPSRTGETPTESLAAAATGTVQAADGVPIVYQAAGDGSTAVVFVHCWACNREFWRHQVEPVVEAGFRVVALDLPGHGESGADRADWSVLELAADVETVIDELSLDRVVLVGHSMGGPVALETARRMSGRVIGIVCVDTLHNAEYEWPEGMADQVVAAMEKDYRGGMEQFVPQLFKPGADPELVQWVIDQAVASDRDATLSLMRDFPNVDMRALLSNAGVPIRCINAAPEGEAGFPTMVETNRKYADFDAVLMERIGHYPQLERPEEFNTILLEALSESERSRP